MKNIATVWERARGHFHYPALKEPKVVKGMGGGACYDFRKRETLVDEKFIKEVCRASGLTEDEALEGVLVHEIGHYMAFPRTLGTLILAAKMIEDFFKNEDFEIREFILQTYADMANDTASVLEEQRTMPILRMREGCQSIKEDQLNHNVREVMLAYLMHQAGREHNLDDELKQYLERMLTIDFLNENVEKMRQGIFEFGTIIIDMIKKCGGGCNGSGKGGTPLLMRNGPLDSDIKEILIRVTEGELREAMREISGKITKREFEKVKKWIKENGGEKGKKVNVPHGVKTIGTSSGELEIDLDVVEYYKGLSTEYPLVVTKKLLETDKNVRTWSNIEKWRPGSDPNLALPVSSGGLYLPGVTKSIMIAHNPVKSTDYKVPHLLVIIDTSGSMPNPKSMKSFGVLGGYCCARSYHIHGSSIGVINFSGDSFYLPYTRELDDALGAIAAYQGGGTVADVEMIRKMLGPEMAELYAKNPEKGLGRLPKEAIKKEVSIGVPDEVFDANSIDVIMFTDGGIFNLNEVLELFEEKAQLNRATIVLTHGFAQEIEDKGDKINVRRIENARDIPEIVIRETSRNFSSYAEGLLWKQQG